MATVTELRDRAAALEKGLKLVPYTVREGKVPSTASADTAPENAQPPILLYRDTNGWCPFCQRVQLALTYKGIPFKSDFIDLRDKPEWYKELVPTALVPAARFAVDDALIWESADLLKEFEARFPDSPPLIPSDVDERARMDAFIEECAEGDDSISSAGYALLIGGKFGEDNSNVSEARLAELQSKLDVAVSRAQPYFQDGFVAGGDSLTMADIMVIPALERLAANLATFRGYDLRGKLEPWFNAIESVEAYQAIRGDAETHNTVVRQLFGVGRDASSLPSPRAEPVTASGSAEAGKRLSSNMEAVSGDIIRNAGLADDEETLEAVNLHLRALASLLLDCAETDVDPRTIRPTQPSPKPSMADIKRMTEAGEDPKAVSAKAARSRAVGAATFAFVRNRVSAPRDMTAAGATAFRAGCDAFLTTVY